VQLRRQLDFFAKQANAINHPLVSLNWPDGSSFARILRVLEAA
jgi:hypothetical protein